MKTTDLFKRNRSARRINESMEKMFGTKLDLASFDMPRLEDARNKLRTQIHDARSQSGFNENIENEALTQAQWMLDAINSELAEREEHVADTTQVEGFGSLEDEVEKILKQFDEDANEIGAYGMPDEDKIVALLKQGDVEGAVEEVWYNYTDQDGGEVRRLEPLVQDLEDEFKYLVDGGDQDSEGGETDDAYALSSAGFGSDEDYGHYGHDESIETEGDSPYTSVSVAQDLYKINPDLDDTEEILNAAFPLVVKMMGGNKKRANYLFNYDEDFPGEMLDAYKWLQRHEHDVGEAGGFGRDAYQRDYDSSVSGFDRPGRDWDEGNTEPPNNFAIYINGKKWKVLAGRGTYADDHRERAQYQQLKDMARKKSEQTGKKWTVSITGENPTESIEEKAPPGAKAERMVKHIKSGYAKDGKLTDKEKGIAYATAWKQHNKEKNESIESGDNMTKLREGEVQQASAIVTAKTMVDRVSRWIEELSGMENDTLLQLGDSIRDEMSAEQAKTFISQCAPAIQQALENLKTTRETLSTGVRMLTGEEQGAEMLGSEPGAEGDMGGEESLGAAEPDMMNAPEAGAEDEFGASEAGAGGLGDAGREQRESVDRSNSLLKILAG